MYTQIFDIKGFQSKQLTFFKMNECLKQKTVDSQLDCRKSSGFFNEIEFEYQDKKYEFGNFAIFGLKDFKCKDNNAKL